MSTVEVFREPLSRRYVVPVCSLSALFAFATLVLLLLTPFFVAYSATAEFWLKENTYREQPRVAYTYEVLLSAGGFNGDRDFSLTYSSSSAVASFFPDQARSGLLQSRERDENRDGLSEAIEINLQIPLAREEQLRWVQMVAFFQSTLSSRARVVFETAAFFEATAGVPGAGVTVDGDFLLRQTYPLRSRGGYQRPYEDEPLLDSSGISSAEQASILGIMEAYAARNLTMVYSPAYLLWHPTPRQQPSNGGPLHDGARVFNVSMTVRIPTERVSYTPQISEVLFDGWIQYLSILVVVAYILEKLLSFVYYNQLVETRVFVDQPSGVALRKLHGL